MLSRGGNFPPIQVKTFESIRGTIADLPVAWFEIHPLFDGQEFDVAILGLKSYIQRNIFLHPICLPKWSTIDLEGKATIDRLYRSTQWEKYQMLYSLKVIKKVRQHVQRLYKNFLFPRLCKKMSDSQMSGRTSMVPPSSRNAKVIQQISLQIGKSIATLTLLMYNFCN